MSVRNHRIAAVAVGATLLVGLGSFGAVASGLVDSSDIKNDSIRSIDIKDETIGLSDISDRAKARLAGQDGKNGAPGVAGKDGAQGPAGKDGINGTDGAPGEQGPQGEQGEQGEQGPQGEPGVDGKDGKNGVTNLIAGAGYNDTWVGDEGATLQTARGECPAGQYALGGGFSTWGGDKDLGGDNKNIQVTVSAPYFEGEYVPVDEAGNFRPTEWVIKGYNNGTADQIVRAWVTCADVN